MLDDGLVTVLQINKALVVTSDVSGGVMDVQVDTGFGFAIDYQPVAL